MQLTRPSSSDRRDLYRRDPARRDAPRDVFARDMLAWLVAVLQRRAALAATIVAVAIGLGVVYLIATPSRYTATASVVIDARKFQLFGQQPLVADTAVVDAGAVDTQVETLKSENIALAVIRELRLADDPEFVGGSRWGLGWLVGAVGRLFEPDAPRSDHEATRKALSVFEARRTVRRVARSHVIEISFRSAGPDKAATIANAIADAYLVDRLESKFQLTNRASLWLQDRIRELRTQAATAERAVIEYKEKHNIVDTGGRLMSEQQLGDLNSQLVLARTATAEAKARLDRINDILRQEVPTESVADALKNDTIIKLRGQYVDIAAREASWSEKYGRTHLATVNLRDQLQEIRRNVAQEVQRIQQAYQSDYDIARAREEHIKRSFANVVSENQNTNQAQVRLRELESDAQTYRTMYDAFMQRHMEAVQQQSFPITEARLVSAASRPLRRSDPDALIVLAVSLAGGLVLGVGAAVFREVRDDVFRTGAQVEEVSGAPCLAVLPRLDRPDHAGAAARPPGFVDPVRAAGMLRHVVDEPFSRFSEAVRSIKVAVDLATIGQTGRVLAVTSTVPSEGKSTVAANLAHLIAHAGAQVALVDCDLRNPALSRALAPGKTQGLVDVVARRAPLHDLSIVDPTTGLTFIPAGTTVDIVHTNEVLAAAATRKLVDSLRGTYDYVVIDLPPLAPIVDVRVTTAFVDAYLFVVAWGSTGIDVVEHHLHAAQSVRDKLLGVALNMADTEQLGRYESFQGDAYYRRHYGRYERGDHCRG